MPLDYWVVIYLLNIFMNALSTREACLLCGVRNRFYISNLAKTREYSGYFTVDVQRYMTLNVCKFEFFANLLLGCFLIA